MRKKLRFDELKKNYDLEKLSIKSTCDVVPFFDLIGQKRAEESIEFALNIDFYGYNVYICGQEGTGRTTFAKKFAQKFAKNKKIPPDLCYIYNFEEPKEPIALYMEPGDGKILKKEMEELIDKFLDILPKIFDSNSFDIKKNKIIKVYQEKHDKIIKEITKEAKQKDFGVKSTQTGIYFMPIIDNEVISEDEFEKLEDQQKQIINEKSESLQLKAIEVTKKIKEIENETKIQIDTLERIECLIVIDHIIGKLIQKYNKYHELTKYFKDVKKSILDNLELFLEEDDSEDEAIQSIIPWYNKKSNEDIFNKYKINLLVDNSKLEHAPVILDFNPTYTNLVGEVEYDSEFGNFNTDFMKIKAGLLHKANGGYLILRISDIANNLYSWDTIKRIFNTKQIKIEPLKEFSTGIVLNCINPDPVNFDLKLIVIGTQFYYNLFNYYDDEFKNVFKIKADFDYEMHFKDENIIKIIGFIKKVVVENKMLDFDLEAIKCILEYSQRIVENQNKFSTNFDKLFDIIIEANTWAKIQNKNIISRDDIIKTITHKEFRNSLYDEKLTEYLDEDVILIETKGKKIGQINGLAVIMEEDYIFAKPSKITATTYVGKSGVINIEKEAKMSGSIHDKGVNILSGFIGQTYAQNFPLTLSCRICFEQNYSGIDGDSASSTELYAILSSLSEVPINQEIAVTGSINQFGDIQPIGGVSYKIEGFFDLCKKRGLTGTQGVIIPRQNISNLTLKDEIIQAVKDDTFHIYPIGHINEGIEILMDLEAGERDENNEFPQNSINKKVYEKLKLYYKITQDDLK